MTIGTLLLVGAGGFAGAILRLEISQRLKSIHTFSIPFATLTVNLIGSFILGFITGASVSHFILLLVGTGMLGSFTTFSTFKFESIQLLRKEKKKALFFYLILSYGGGLLFAYSGLLLGKMLL
ncbi:fluoride efflux transporter FluC [Bacillus chungangensis]|uniref:Fluoride-specific ion channel FluC n=1 Tax=Bacillus chungangensis TaxID=587633 RepID=A0ABT9WWE7_9BACI|nr:CrcB family protein [Bacillus chungangensis]MDQ0177622.1 CrcB protein [Bacillus chungangensis]